MANNERKGCKKSSVVINNSDNSSAKNEMLESSDGANAENVLTEDIKQATEKVDGEFIENSAETDSNDDSKDDKVSKKNSTARTLTKRIAFSAVFMALIIVFTSFVKVPIGIGGYIHLGDLMIYLCASVLPLPFALIVAGVGGALSDVIAGYPIWAPFTLVIKMLLVLCFTPKKDTVLCVRNYIATAICLVITMVGYFFAEVIIYGDWGAYINMPWNLIQALISGVVYIIIGIAFDKLKVKEKILKL